jgi:hypothetical protein
MNTVLLLLAIGLSGLLYVQWEIAPERAPPPPPRHGETPAGAGEGVDAGAQADDFTLGDPASFDVISQRPLFIEGRRPEDAEVPEAVGPQQKEPLQGLDLTTVLITPDERTAWVKDAQTGELTRLLPGKQIRGWTVQAVEPDRLLLEAGGEKSELELREFKDMAAAPPVQSVNPGARVPARRPAAAQRPVRAQRPTPTNRRPRR